MQPICISIREVCSLLRIGKTTAHKLCREQILKSFKIGGNRRVTLESVQALAESAIAKEAE